MATINELPNELLIDIFEHLADYVPRPIGDLLSLSFTSRRFRIAAEPFLYHTYEGHSCTSQGYSRQHLFAKTLVEQPALAKHVRKLNLALHRVVEDKHWRNYTATTQEIATAKLQNAAGELGLPSPITDDWKRAIECADRQAYAANILFSTSRTVEDLCLRYDHRRFENDPSSPSRWYQYNWIFVALRLATMQQSLASNSFQNLRTLKMVR
jgi:hypothetical protein